MRASGSVGSLSGFGRWTGACADAVFVRIILWLPDQHRRFVVTLAAAVEHQRHQADAHDHREHHTEKPCDITPCRRLGRRAEPAEIAERAGTDEESAQHRYDRPSRDL